MSLDYHLSSDVAAQQLHHRSQTDKSVQILKWTIERLPTTSVTNISCKRFDNLLCRFASFQKSLFFSRRSLFFFIIKLSNSPSTFLAASSSSTQVWTSLSAMDKLNEGECSCFALSLILTTCKKYVFKEDKKNTKVGCQHIWSSYSSFKLQALFFTKNSYYSSFLKCSQLIITGTNVTCSCNLFSWNL